MAGLASVKSGQAAVQYSTSPAAGRGCWACLRLGAVSLPRRAGIKIGIYEIYASL